MTETRIVAATSLTACAFASAVAAATGTEPDGGFERRLYAGGGVLISRLEPDTGADPELELDGKRGAGGSLTIGYDLGDRFSVEAHVAALGEATLAPEGDVAYRTGGLSALVYGLNEASARRLREGFSAFGRLGVGLMRNRADGVELERVNDAHVLFGGGIEYGLDNGLALRAELVGHDADASYAQLALLYRFGDARRAVAPGVPSPPVAPDTPPRNPSPEGDADGDGVPDIGDGCRDTPAGRPVDANGCELFDGPIDAVAFRAGSATLTEEARSVLADLALTLREYPSIVVAIEAHTDNRGPAENNLELSRRRALAVARLLVDEGVEPSRLRPRAYGESRPRASNATAEGRARNRRVELAVVE